MCVETMFADLQDGHAGVGGSLGSSETIRGGLLGRGAFSGLIEIQIIPHGLAVGAEKPLHRAMVDRRSTVRRLAGGAVDRCGWRTWIVGDPHDLQRSMSLLPDAVTKCLQRS